MASLDDKEVREVQKTVFTLIQESKFEPAVNLIQTLLEHDPNDALALNFLGIIHLELRNFHLAYQYLRRSLQEKSNIAPVWTNFGLAAHELGRNEEAINAYLKSASIDNDLR